MRMPELEWWERVERAALIVFGSLFIAVPLGRLALGYGGLTQLLLLPFGFWCFWQAFYEDRLDDGAPPTVTERVLAVSWLMARRFTVGTVGLIFIAFGVYFLSNSRPSDIWGAITAIAFGIFALWVAFYGGGRRAYGTDARQIHLGRKKRYKWRF